MLSQRTGGRPPVSELHAPPGFARGPPEFLVIVVRNPSEHPPFHLLLWHCSVHCAASDTWQRYSRTDRLADRFMGSVPVQSSLSRPRRRSACPRASVRRELSENRLVVHLVHHRESGAQICEVLPLGATERWGAADPLLADSCGQPPATDWGSAGAARRAPAAHNSSFSTIPTVRFRKSCRDSGFPEDRLVRQLSEVIGCCCAWVAPLRSQCVAPALKRTTSPRL